MRHVAEPHQLGATHFQMILLHGTRERKDSNSIAGAKSMWLESWRHLTEIENKEFEETSLAVGTTAGVKS